MSIKTLFLNTKEKKICLIKPHERIRAAAGDFKGNLNLNLSTYPKGIYLIIITNFDYSNPDINKIILI